MSSPFASGLARPAATPVTVAMSGTGRLAAVSDSTNLAGRRAIVVSNVSTSNRINVWYESGATNQVTFIPAGEVLVLIASASESYWLTADAGTDNAVIYETNAL